MNYSINHDEILSLERRLYSPMRVSDKYDILERIRLAIDYLYSNDRPTYDTVRNTLRENTWDALEENWKLWNPTPSSNVKWSGPDDLTCYLLPSHPAYADCERLGFASCQYDRHGSPDFSRVTFPGSAVDISDLYDSLSIDNIQKRGGSRYSLQEIAQDRMYRNLMRIVDSWAKANGCEPDFYRWRDSLDLVPHEDTDCRTMRLVPRTLHSTFKHRGGVANAINIKSHF